MSVKANSAKLNPLQARTLTLLQAIARLPGATAPQPDGTVQILQFPQMHGDHFHLGNATVMKSDATGLENQAVWNALSRKGLIQAEWPNQIALTPDGLGYNTGSYDILRAGGGH
jgi:hypothetical protein